jgi:hypothetical protein
MKGPSLHARGGKTPRPSGGFHVSAMFCLALILCLLTGCTLGPPCQRPDLTIPAQWDWYQSMPLDFVLPMAEDPWRE